MKNELKQSLLDILGSPEFDIHIRNAGKFRFPINYLFGVHSHIEFEMNYINSGNCVMEIGGVLTSLKQGDCVIISPNIPHYFMVGMQRGCSIVQLEYSMNLPERIGESFSSCMAKESTYKSQTVHPLEMSWRESAAAFGKRSLTYI